MQNRFLAGVARSLAAICFGLAVGLLLRLVVVSAYPATVEEPKPTPIPEPGYATISVDPDDNWVRAGGKVAPGKWVAIQVDAFGRVMVSPESVQLPLMLGLDRRRQEYNVALTDRKGRVICAPGRER